MKAGPDPTNTQGATDESRVDDERFDSKEDESKVTPERSGDEADNASKIKIDTGDGATPEDDGIGEGGRSGSNINGSGTIKYAKFPGTVSEQQINDWVAKDKEKRGAAAADYRYAFIPNEFQKGRKEKLRPMRQSLTGACRNTR